MPTCNRLLAGAASLVLATSLGAIAAFAQDTAPQAAADTGIADIIVTAQKREERLQDVPIAITALGSATLAKLNVAAITDFNRLSVPGLVTVAFVGTPTMGINIRGISTQDPGVTTIEAPTAIYIDGVYIPRSQGLGSEVMDVERLEVLRGPQGTLFGRNAEGGAISIVSKKPTGKLEGSIGGTIGSFGLKKANIHLNLPAFANISARVDGYISKLDGYTKNGPNDTVSRANLTSDQIRNFGEGDNKGIRGQLLWEPSSDFSALISADYSDLKNAVTYQHYDTANMILTATDIGSYRKQTDWAYYLPYTLDKVKGVSGTLTYKVSDNLTLKSITAYRVLDSAGGSQLGTFSSAPSVFFGMADPAGTLLSGLFTNYDTHDKSFSEEVQLLGKTSDVEYVLGAFYFRETADDLRNNFFTLKAIPGQTPFSIKPVPLPTSIQSVRSSTFAMFAQATWAPSALGGRLKITPGLRYTETTKSGIRTQGKFGPGAGDFVTPGNPLIRQIPSLSRVDPALTIAYDINPDFNIYLRYAQAFRDGGVTVRSNTFSTFGPETNRQLELGSKGEFLDHRLRVYLAAFHSWIKGAQVSISPPNDPTAQEIINVDGTRIWGLEGEVTVAPTRGLTIGGNFAILRGHQPDFPCLNCVKRTIVFLPRFSGGVNVDYTVPVAGSMEAFFHLDYKYQSDFHTSPRSLPGQIWGPSRYNVLCARVGVNKIDLGAVKANISAYVDNLNNNHDKTFDTSGPFQTLQLPRRFGVAASVDF